MARHTLFDDAQALLTGTLFVGLGLTMFRHAGLMTGGTVGLAFLAHYATGWAFGPLFFAINLPFYALAWRRMGRRFTLKTVAAVTLLSLLSEALPAWIRLASVAPWFAALGGGLLVG
ncbi:MAG: YitT family protein, partial [Burkholderiaceae bacterium]